MSNGRLPFARWLNIFSLYGSSEQPTRRLVLWLLLALLMMFAVACSSEPVTDSVENVESIEVADTPTEDAALKDETVSAEIVEVSAETLAMDGIAADEIVSEAVALTDDEIKLAAAVDNVMTTFEASDDFSGAVLVAQDGKILLSQGYGLADKASGEPFTPQTKQHIALNSHAFVAMAMMLLQADGEISLQDNACNYLTVCQEAWGEFTIHHLLAHRTGIPHYGWSEEFWETADTPRTMNEVLALIADEPLVFPTDTDLALGGINSMLAALIIEEVTGQPHGDFIAERIFTPLGMVNSGVGASDEVATAYKGDVVRPYDLSNFLGSGDIYSTVEDLYLWEQEIENPTLLSAEQMAPMLEWHSEFLVEETIPVGFGYGWFMGNNPVYSQRHLWTNGAGVWSDIARYPQNDVTFILLSNQDSIPYQEMRQQWINPAVLGLEMAHETMMEGVTSDSDVFFPFAPETAVGTSHLVRAADGIHGEISASELTPGDVVTFWYILFNHPELCEAGPFVCSIEDLGASRAAQGDFVYVQDGGAIVADDGTIEFSGGLTVGDVSGSGLAEFPENCLPELEGCGGPIGLLNPETALVIFGLHSHGVPQEGEILDAQFNSYLGGCESIIGTLPGGFSADASEIPDEVGECATVQISPHAPASSQSMEADDAMMEESAEIIEQRPVLDISSGELGDPIEGASVQLTRRADGFSVVYDATELPIGHVVSLWAYTFNNPAACDNLCDEDDVFIGGPPNPPYMNEDGTAGRPGTDFSLMGFGGIVVENSTHRFEESIDIFTAPLRVFGNGLHNPIGAEIHFAIRDHGPANADPTLLEEQMSVGNGGCANFNGTGDYTCVDFQLSLFGEERVETVEEQPVLNLGNGEIGDPVESANVQLTRHANGFGVVYEAADLPVGHVVSLWAHTFNNPAACDDLCDPDDVFVGGPPNPPYMNEDGTAGRPGTDYTLMGFGGLVVEESTHRFEEHITIFTAPKRVFGNGLHNPMGAEIHFVIRDHGPASEDPDLLEAQMSVGNGGCANFNGTGEYLCADFQISLFGR